MTVLRWVLLVSSLVLSVTAHAQNWNDAEIVNASKQAEASINLFLKNDKNSTLFDLLTATEANELKQKVSFTDSDKKDFSHLKNKVDVLHFLYEHINTRESVPYLSLYLNFNSKTLENSLQVDLAEAILMDDDTSAKYAFNRLNRLDLSQNKKLQKKKVKIQKWYGFNFDSFDVDGSQKNPKVCLKFSQQIRPEPAQKWQNLIHIQPEPKRSISFHGDSLCFDGEWQSDYNVSIDKALQSLSLLNLKQRVEEKVSTGTRLPMVRFASNGTVLKGDNRKLALTTSNIDNVEVSLWQIPANNLSNEQVQSIIQSTSDISTWRLDKKLYRHASQLFTGSFSVEDYVLNSEVTTNIFLDDMLSKPAVNKISNAGIYVMTANDKADSDERTAIAFSLSNAGFSAYLTKSGLWAEMRSLDSGSPISGHNVTLYAQNNTILSYATTDDIGQVHFEKPIINGEAGLKPSHIISENGEHFAHLSLVKKPIDLSDKGLSGAIHNSPLRSWIWTDRGVYRPNDTVHMMWLLKTKEGQAFHSAPIWLELVRPDGKVYLDEMVVADHSGAYSFDHYFDNSSRQGNWSVRLSLGRKGKVIANKSIPLASITPDQIEVTVSPLSQPIVAGEEFSIEVNADWLYGAPATELYSELEHEFKARGLTDKKWKGWQVGLHDEVSLAESSEQKTSETNAKGKAIYPILFNQLPYSTKPLQVKFSANVNEPSGKQVKRSYKKDVYRNQPYLALQIADGNQLDVAQINDDGNVISGDVDWTLYRVHYNYHWYKKDGSWLWQFDESRQKYESASVTLADAEPTRLSLPIDDGSWVVVVRGKNAQVAASIPLTFGKYVSPKKNNAPDHILITSEFERYVDGETVTLQLNAPFDGKGSVKFALNDEIIDHKQVPFENGQAKVTFKWREEWKQGLWLLVNAWNKDQESSHNRRAVGLHWIGGDLTTSKIDVSATLPDVIEPNTTLTIPLQIKNVDESQTTWARVAVVDEGLYRLAKASFSDPLNAFWDKKQLNISYFDVWGTIIKAVIGRQASLRSGADGMSKDDDLRENMALPELDLTLVAFWSKPVAFDSEGKASVDMKLPQFNGRVRVMTAVWNDTQLGAFEQEVTVRAPLVTTLYVPKFLSPNDKSHVRLRLHNTTDTPINVSALVSSEQLTLLESEKQSITIAPDQSIWVRREFRLSDVAKGRAEIKVEISGDQTLTLKRFMDIRPLHAVENSRSLFTLESGKKKEIPAITDGKSLSRKVVLSSQAPFDTSTLLSQLDTYAYGCTEQITSKSWNNLLFPELQPKYSLSESKWGHADDWKKRLLVAHSLLANRQNNDGSFSLWHDGTDENWLSAYVTEFLLASKQSNQLGNERALSLALTYLREVVTSEEDVDASIAYSHYVLAKAGEPVQGSAMRFAETLLSSQPVMDAKHVHSVAALVYHGDVDLATKLMNKISDTPYDFANFDVTDDYGSGVRNIAQTMVVLYDLRAQLTKMNANESLLSSVQGLIDKLWSPLQQSIKHRSYLSTQDLHWLAALSALLPTADDDVNVTVNGNAITFFGQKSFTLKGADNLSIVNASGTPIYATVNDWVIPTKSHQREEGFTIQMRYLDKKGMTVDITKLKQNQQVFAIATITADKNNINSDVMFSYPLPAGLTVSELFASLENAKELQGLRKSPLFSENRDDRHLAAFHLDDNKPFTYVFVLTATAKGEWHAPEYHIENMYQPQFRAVYPMPVITVE